MRCISRIIPAFFFLFEKLREAMKIPGQERGLKPSEYEF
jgi:hypothetical protein